MDLKYNDRILYDNRDIDRYVYIYISTDMCIYIYMYISGQYMNGEHTYVSVLGKDMHIFTYWES